LKVLDAIPLRGGDTLNDLVTTGIDTGRLTDRLRQACNPVAEARNAPKIIRLILKILFILSYWNIATSVRMKP